jgi:surface antigen
MQVWPILNGLALAVAVAAPAAAAPAIGIDPLPGAQAAGEQPYIQCAPYARQVSGVELYGDAWTWWDQAEGRYERGHRPRVGAVMAFEPHSSMRLGHVAAVSRVIDARTVLLRHANWSPVDGRRGRIEDDVVAVDVSPRNDWSAVRVWYDPVQDLGKTVWPVAGFIYNRPVGDAAGSARREREIPDSGRSASDSVGKIIASRSTAHAGPRIGYAELDR